jgi:hypothetical protein
MNFVQVILRLLPPPWLLICAYYSIKITTSPKARKNPRVFVGGLLLMAGAFLATIAYCLWLI